MSNFTLAVDTDIVRLDSRKIVVTSSGVNREGDLVESIQTITKKIGGRQNTATQLDSKYTTTTALQTDDDLENAVTRYESAIESLKLQLEQIEVDSRSEIFCKDAKIAELQESIQNERLETTSRLCLTNQKVADLKLKIEELVSSSSNGDMENNFDQPMASDESEGLGQEVVDHGHTSLQEVDQPNESASSTYVSTNPYDDQQQIGVRVQEPTQTTTELQCESAVPDEELHRQELSRIRKTAKANMKRQRKKSKELEAENVGLKSELNHNNSIHLEQYKELLQQIEHWKMCVDRYRNLNALSQDKNNDPVVIDLLNENSSLHDQINVLKEESEKFRMVEDDLRDQLIKSQDAMNIHIKAAQRSQVEKVKAQNINREIGEELVLERKKAVQQASDRNFIEASTALIHQVQTATTREEMEAASNSFKSGFPSMMAEVLAQKKVADIENDVLRRKLAKATKELEEAKEKNLEQEKELNATFLIEENAREQAPLLKAEIEDLKTKLEHCNDAMALLTTENYDKDFAKDLVKKNVCTIQKIMRERDDIRQELSDAKMEIHELKRAHDVEILDMAGYIKGLEDNDNVTRQGPDEQGLKESDEYGTVTYSNPNRHMVRVAREAGYNSNDIPRHILSQEGYSNIGGVAPPAAHAIGKLYPHLMFNALVNNDVGLAFPKVRAVSIEDARRALRDDLDLQLLAQDDPQTKCISVKKDTDIEPRDPLGHVRILEDAQNVEINLMEPFDAHLQQSSDSGEADTVFQIPEPEIYEENPYLASIDDKLEHMHKHQGFNPATSDYWDLDISGEDHNLAFLDAKLCWKFYDQGVPSHVDETWFIETAKKISDPQVRGAPVHMSGHTSTASSGKRTASTGNERVKTETPLSELFSEDMARGRGTDNEDRDWNTKRNGPVEINEDDTLTTPTSGGHDLEDGHRLVDEGNSPAHGANADDTILNTMLVDAIDIDEHEEGELPGGERIGIPDFMRRKLIDVNKAHRDIIREAMGLPSGQFLR